MCVFPKFREALFLVVSDLVERYNSNPASHLRAAPPRSWHASGGQLIRLDSTPYLSELNAESEASWSRLVDAVNDEEILKAQIGKVATIGLFSSLAFHPPHFLPFVFPRLQFNDLGEPEPLTLDSFDSGYEELERFITSDALTASIVWPLEGLDFGDTTIPLGPDLCIRPLTLNEAATAQRYRDVTGFSHSSTIPARMVRISALEYSEAILKCGGGEVPARDKKRELRKLLALFRAASATMGFPPTVPDVELQSCVGSEPVVTSNLDRLARPHFESSKRRQWVLPPQSSEFQLVWRVLKEGTGAQCNAVRLAARRLSYALERERLDDRLLDVIVAAEALYLSEDGGRAELTYRAALRASLWADPKELGMSRRNVFEVIHEGYVGRSIIAHGGELGERPKPACGLETWPALVESAATIVRVGIKKAALRVAQSDTQFEFGWKQMLFDRIESPPS